MMDKRFLLALTLFYVGIAIGAAEPIKEKEQQKKLEESHRLRGRNLEWVFGNLIREFYESADAKLIHDAVLLHDLYGDYSFISHRLDTIYHKINDARNILKQLASQPDKGLTIFKRANEIKGHLNDAKKAFDELCNYIKENKASFKEALEPNEFQRIMQILEKRAANEKKAPKLKEEIDQLTKQVDEWIAANRGKIDAIKKLQGDVDQANLSNPFFNEMM